MGVGGEKNSHRFFPIVSPHEVPHEDAMAWDNEENLLNNPTLMRKWRKLNKFFPCVTPMAPHPTQGCGWDRQWGEIMRVQ